MQLAHIAKEQDAEHGFVTVKASDGKIVAESSNFQRNPFIKNKEERTANLMAQILAELAKGLGNEAKEPTHSDSEGSTKAASEGDA